MDGILGSARDRYLKPGRPPTFSLLYNDYQFLTGGSTDNKPAFPQVDPWASQFTSSSVADVAARALVSDPPRYSTVLSVAICTISL
ncbi:hypothetical protein EDD17DRAFT_1764533 [Pisolithus thermaeus]|nr:hypothetical protein EDD17DRAFT_1764533 [Pisolithus thermaeus]